MKNDDGALSFGTSVDLRGLETGISQIEAKIATMEGKLGAKIDGIGKAVQLLEQEAAQQRAADHAADLRG